MLYILNSIPLALYDKIPNLECCQEYELILSMRKIVNVMLAFRLSIDQIAVLKNDIKQYLELRISLFPDVMLKPKHHFLEHYPKLIQDFGPLRHMWTLRFESKHKYFKDVIRHSPNFKNALFSLATKHQYLQALAFSSKDLYDSKAKSDNYRPFLINEFSNILLNVLTKSHQIGIFRFITEDVTFRGIMYEKDMYVGYSKSNITLSYELCKIVYILLSNNLQDIYFVGKNVQMAYNCNIGLYEQIQDSNSNDHPYNICISYDNLMCYEPLLHFHTNNVVLYFNM